MADKIIFSNKINVSAQIGDELWYSDVTIPSSPTGPISLGIITEISDTWVKVDTPVSSLGQTYPDLIVNGGFALTAGPEQVTNGSFTGIADGTQIDQVIGWGNYGTVTSRTIQNEELELITTTTNTGAKLTITTAVDGQLYHVTADTSGDTGANGVYITGIAGSSLNHSTIGGVNF